MIKLNQHKITEYSFCLINDPDNSDSGLNRPTTIMHGKMTRLSNTFIITFPQMNSGQLCLTKIEWEKIKEAVDKLIKSAHEPSEPSLT